MTETHPAPTTMGRAFWAGVVVFVLTGVGLLALLLGVRSAVEDQRLVPIANVRVIGERQHLTDTEIQAALNRDGGLGSLVMQDVSDIQQRIKALPWVDTVAVRKSYPDSINLYVVEQKPVAQWNQDALLNERAEVFAVPDRQQAGALPAAQGPTGSGPKVLDMLQRLTELLRFHGMDMASIALTARHAWQLTLSNGIELRLGREDGVNRVSRFIQLFESLSEQERALVAYVDLRYDTGAAVGWKNEQVNQAKVVE